MRIIEVIRNNSDYVQVAYLNGNLIPLNPDDYLESDVKPPMESLPDAEEYFNLQEQAKGK